jgi:putative membrane protein
MKYKNGFRRAGAMALAGAMVCSLALGTAADGNVAAQKDETVYATLASDGTVQSVTDSVWLHADKGLSGYVDDTGLTDITMLKGTETPAENGSTLTFQTDDTDAWYQGTASAQLPITAQVTWTLDGQEMTAEQMEGKSGHLVMHISFTNNSYTTQTIDGVSRRIYTPLVTVVAATLDTDVFTNVDAGDGMTQSDSSRDLVGYICLPGLSETYDGLLTGKFSQLSDYLHDDVTLEADVTDFEMPLLYVAAAQNAADFQDDAELSDYQDLFDGLDELSDAMDQLIDGAQQLLTGSSSLDDGTGTLYDGIQKLDTGIGTLQSGAQSLDDGAATVQSGAHSVSSGAASAAGGAAQLQSGLSTLSGNSQALRTGAHQIGDSLLASANTQLKASGVLTSDMTWENYATVMGDILNITDDMRTQAKETIRAQAQASLPAGSPALTDAQLNALLYMTASSGSSDVTAALKAAGASMSQAQQDTAAGGSIGLAQKALSDAGGDPTQVDAVKAVLRGTAYASLLSRITAQGVSTDNAKVMLTMAAQAMAANSALTLDDALSSAGTQLAAAGTLSAASAEATAYAADLTADPAVAAMLQKLVDAGAAPDLATAQTAVSAQINAGANTPVIEVLAAQAMAADSTLDMTAALTNAAAAASAGAAAAPAVTSAQTALAAAGGDASQVAAVAGVVDSLTGTAYTAIASGITATSDASVKAAMITMAAQAMSANASLSLADALTAAGKTLTNAQTVQTALTVTNDPSNADYAKATELIKGFLTTLVQTEKKDDLEAVRTALTQLQSVNAFVTGIDSYTAGVDSAASGANALVDGLNTLASGSAQLASGTDSLKSGADQVVSGANSLKSGADQLLSGAAALKDGTSTLKDGVQQLYDGLNEFNTEGISKLTDSTDLTNLQTLLDVTDAVKAQAEQVNGFAGSGDADSTAKYLLRVTAEKTDTASADADTTSAGGGNFFAQLWQRIVALFR